MTDVPSTATPVAPAAPSVVKAKKAAAVRPAVGPSKLRGRHYGLFASFQLLVVLPLIVLVAYLSFVAQEQYSSVSGFTVRKEEGGGASELLGGLAGLTGNSGGSDGDILYEFIRSHALIQSVDERVGVRAHYSAQAKSDPIFALAADASIEDLERYWTRIVRVSFDRSSGLTQLRVLAFDPNTAQQISTEILRLSQDMINGLNTQAREDAMGYARADLAEAVARLKVAREALTSFRTRTQIVDPETDMKGRMGVLNNLQQQLAEALINLDLLRGTSRDDDPRVKQAQRLIDVISTRIMDERNAFSTGVQRSGDEGEDYPSLIAEYEGLMVDREFAEQNYRAALAALDLARAMASRQSRYLATYVHPTLAQTSEYPQRWTIFGVAALFLTLSWAVMALVYYSIRDRS